MRTIDEVLDSIQQLRENTEFLPTGFPQLDKTLDGGLMRKELVVIGGFTGVGKSYIAGQIMYNIVSKGFRCGYFSLEISSEMVVSRLIGSLSNIKPTRVIHDTHTPEESERIEKAKMHIQAYSDLMHVYDDTYELLKIGEAVMNNKYDLVIIDFLQNIYHKGEEYERMSYVSLYLQKLAKKANCCIIAVSQLSNSASKTGVLEYKGSGSIATVCDLGFFIKRNESDGKKNTVDLMLRKNRRGFSGEDFELTFNIPGGSIHEKRN